ncbi:MAG TPA: hypothetical protein VK714_21250 [Myxococcota bacterium]|nr:hypothetical protein [Myxococcota bacterium]
MGLTAGLKAGVADVQSMLRRGMDRLLVRIETDVSDILPVPLPRCSSNISGLT